MRRSLPVLSVAALATAAGCTSPGSTVPFQGDSGGSTAGGTTGSRRGTSGSGTSAGRSNGSSSRGGSSGGASGSSGSGGSSTGGGSSGGPVCGGGFDGGPFDAFECQNLPAYLGASDGCPADWFGTAVVDFAACQPVCGATVQALAPAGTLVAGTSVLTDAVTGGFHFCLPVNQTFETAVSAPGYATHYYSEITGQLGVGIPRVGLLSPGTLTALAASIPALATPMRGLVVATIAPKSGCGTGPNETGGFELELRDEDGGSYPDGGYRIGYLDTNGLPNPALTETSAYGVALLYDIDTRVATFPTVLIANLDAGGCVELNQMEGLTGRVQVGPDIVSVTEIILQQ